MATENEVTIKFTTRWDRDERGPYPEVDVIVYPDWMSIETIHAIAKDVSAEMLRNKK